MLKVASFADGMEEIKFLLEKYGALTYKSVEKAKKDFRNFLGSDCTFEKACEATVEKINREFSAIRKSEAAAVAAATSDDFTISPAPWPAAEAAAATHALRVQGLANAATRRLQTWGVENPSEGDYDRAFAAIANEINLGIFNYEGENGITVDHSNPQVAARLRDLPSDGTIWEPTDMASSRQRDMVDEQMVASAVTGFSGVRNIGYTNQRRVMPEGTSFSGTGGASIPAGTSEGPTVTDQQIQAIAQAAYRAGLAAGGSSNFSKRRR